MVSLYEILRRITELFQKLAVVKQNPGVVRGESHGVEEQFPSFLILIDSLHLQSGIQGVQGFSIVRAVYRPAQNVGSVGQIFLVEVVTPGLLEVRKNDGDQDHE